MGAVNIRENFALPYTFMICEHVCNLSKVCFVVCLCVHTTQNSKNAEEVPKGKIIYAFLKGLKNAETFVHTETEWDNQGDNAGS